MRLVLDEASSCAHLGRDARRIGMLRGRGLVHVSAPRGAVVAGEERTDYDAVPYPDEIGQPDFIRESMAKLPWVVPKPRSGEAPTAEDALAALETALDLVQAVEWDAESVDDTRAAPIRLQRLANRLAAAQVGNLGSMDRRGLHGLDGSASLTAWFRNRTNLDHRDAKNLCAAARRLPSLPLLGQALADGDVTFAHVAVIARAATPARLEAFASCDEPLTEVARNEPPRKVAEVVKFLRDQIDPDGSDPKPPKTDWTGGDPRRQFTIWDTIDKLKDGRLLLGQLDGELLQTLLDAFDEPDPPDTPEDQRRSPEQRRADAFAKILQAAARSKDAPTLQGAPARTLGMVDLSKWLGHPEFATFKDQLRYSGEIDIDQALRLLQDSSFTPVLMWGPWRVVSVGRTMRTAPAWMRDIAQMIWRECPGPDCDRPASWGEAHHEIDWRDGGETDLNLTLMPCHRHHDMLTTGGWTVRADRDTGVLTWTSPDGRTFDVHPP